MFDEIMHFLTEKFNNIDRRLAEIESKIDMTQKATVSNLNRTGELMDMIDREF